MLTVIIATKLILLLFFFHEMPFNPEYGFINIADGSYSEDNKFSTYLSKQKDILACSLKNGEDVFLDHTVLRK